LLGTASITLAGEEVGRNAQGGRKLVATLRAIPEEVGDAEHGGHVNQLRHQRAPQELTQPG
jgi:hypothetical protein